MKNVKSLNNRLQITGYALLLLIAISQGGVLCARGNEVANKPLAPGAILSRLVDQSSTPVSNVPLIITVEVLNDGVVTSSVINLESDSEGKFSFIAPKTGNVSIYARPKALAQAHWQITKRGDIGDLVLNEGFQTKIKLLTPEGKPISGIFLRLISEPPDFGMSILGEKPTDSNGYCTFPRVDTGRYRIIVDTRRSRNALAKLPYAIVGQTYSLSNDAHEKKLVAVKTTSATITFDDGIDAPAGAQWGYFSTIPGDDRSWRLSFADDAKRIGKGVYSIDKIPQNVPLGISISRDKNLVFSCRIAEQTAKLIVGFRELGGFTEPLNLTIFSHNAGSIKLSAQDKNGKNIDRFFAVGHYPDLSSYLNGKSWWGEDVMESPYRIKPEQLWKKFIDPRLLLAYDFTRSFEYRSQVTFSWYHTQQMGQILNIFPNEKVILILYDTQGRQGFIETKVAEGEKKEIVVVLE